MNHASLQRSTSRAPAQAASTRSGAPPSTRARPAPSALSMRAHGIQPKLEVNQPGDHFEQEADAVAGTVMRAQQPTPAERQQHVSAAQNPRAIHRCAACHDHETPCPACAQNPRAIGIQRVGVGAPAVTQKTDAAIRNPDAGQPLPLSMRRRIEPHVGADLSNVRVHSDPAARQAAGSLQAVAFTHQNHIFLKHGASANNLGLMAHEATHVAQQGAADVQRAPDVQRTSISQIFDDPGAVWDATTGAVVDAAGEVVAAGTDALLTMVRQVAPQALLDFIDSIKEAGGIFAYLKHLLSGAFDQIFDTLHANSSGSVTELVDTLRAMLELSPQILAALKAGNCEPLFAAVGLLGDALGKVAGEAWDKLTEMLQPVGEFFSQLWHDFGAPAVDWLKKTAGDIWATIQNMASQIWAWTQPVRDLPGAAWTWIKEQLGFDSDDQGGLTQWITDKVGAVWDEIKVALQPVIAPIQDMANRILDFLPLGAILNLRDKVRSWVEQAKTMAQQMSAGDGEQAGVVANQNTLRAEILPAVKARIGELQAGLADAGGWVADQIGALGAAATGFMDSLRANEYLSPLAGAIDWIETSISDMVAWVQSSAQSLFATLGDGLGSLAEFIEPVLNTLEKVVDFLGDMIGHAADLVLGPLKLIPACISDPIKDFIITQILEQIPLFGQLMKIPDMWQKLKNIALSILKKIFVSGDLFGAAWEFYRSMLELVGISAQLVTEVINKSLQVFGDILDDPASFLHNLFSAIAQGFQQFIDHIGKHLLNGIIDWLFGNLKDLHIDKPKDFSLGSLFGLVMQVLGISYSHILTLIRKKNKKAADFIEKTVKFLSGAWEWIKTLIEEGPAGVWKKIKEKVGDIKNMLIQAAIGWLTEKITTKVMTKLATSGDPLGIGATINTIILILDTIETVVRYANDILGMVNTTLDGIGGIVKGALDQAAGFLEGALASAIPTAIGFMLGVVGLPDVGGGVRDAILDLREEVDEGINWLIDLGLSAFEAVKNALGLGKKDEKDKDKDIFSFEFEAGEKEHHLKVDVSKSPPSLSVESTPKTVAQFLADIKNRIDALPATDPDLPALQATYQDATNLANQVGVTFAALLGPQSGTRATSATEIKEKLDPLIADLAMLIDLAQHGAHTGLKNDPIPIIWYKPETAYTSFSLTIDGRTQTFDRFQEASIPTPPRMEGLSVGGEIEIGVASENQPTQMMASQKLLYKMQTGGSTLARGTGYETKFKKLLATYGFDWSAYSPDHVQDLAIGGFDQFDNLWPLNKPANLAGNQVYNQRVLVLEGVNTKLCRVIDLAGKYFFIRKIE